MLHTPVLLEEALQYLDPKNGESYLDLTAGYGGHASEVLKRTSAPENAILVDRDAKAVDELSRRFKAIRILHTDFFNASQKLEIEGKRFDMILADLGISSPHLDNASRGFSIKAEGPLDMRMDQSSSPTAADIVNSATEAELVQILRDYGEEPKASRIAKELIAQRPINTTSQLATIVARVWGGQSRVHPATRTFQALRIAVNDELGLLRNSLPIWLKLLNAGGRMVVISFHSLEDRIVKQFLQEYSGNRYDAELKLLTKSPILATSIEIVSNPRARSAKLRAAAKQK
jgi:16S rRNA (cytosine1402-N4)-methyltransferase